MKVISTVMESLDVGLNSMGEASGTLSSYGTFSMLAYDGGLQYSSDAVDLATRFIIH
jgi:hypothetical protein